MLSKVTRGIIQRPELMLVYGPDGTGKTTLAAGAPAPLILGAEEGSNNLDVERLGIASLLEMKTTLSELVTEKHNHKTLVLDSADWFEKIVWGNVIENWKPKIYSIDEPGFGKGRVRAFEIWLEILPMITACRNHGMNVIILAHSKVKKFEDPQTPQGYDRYMLALQDGPNSDVAGLLRQYVDTLLFMNTETLTTADDKRRGFGEGQRVLYTERRPAFDAKNRDGLPFTINIPNSRDPKVVWNAYLKAKGEPMTSAPSVDVDVLAQMTELIDQLKPELRAAALKAVERDKNDPAKLAKTKENILISINKGK
jgi:hypothetical protein